MIDRNMRPISTEASSLPLEQNAALAVLRTRMSADRTLMSMIRAALALIGFGYTVALLFRGSTESTVMHGDTIAGRRFGIALVLVGILMLVLGILYRLTFLRESRRAWRQWAADGLTQSGSAFRVSLALMIAVILLAISVAAILGLVFNIGPF